MINLPWNNIFIYINISVSVDSTLRRIIVGRMHALDFIYRNVSGECFVDHNSNVVRVRGYGYMTKLSSDNRPSANAFREIYDPKCIFPICLYSLLDNNLRNFSKNIHVVAPWNNKTLISMLFFYCTADQGIIHSTSLLSFMLACLDIIDGHSLKVEMVYFSIRRPDQSMWDNILWGKNFFAFYYFC